MRLIDADAMKTVGAIQMADYNSIESIRAWIDSQPTVEERRTGKWTVDDNVRDALVWDYKCSECGYEFESIDGVPYISDMKFCPHCGARMVNVDV